MRLLPIVLSGLLLCGTLYGFESDERVEWLVDYTGDINEKYDIGMTLIFYKHAVHGVYFYHNYMQDITITGQRYKDSKIQILEMDEHNNVAGVFDGRFIDCNSEDPRHRYGEKGEKKELNQEVLIGTYTRIEDGAQMPFYLGLGNATSRRRGKGRYWGAGAEDDSLINRSAQKFWRAVKSNHKKKAAGQISYPIDVHIDGTKVTIKNKNELVENYEKIFHPSFRKRIADSVPHNMFVNYGGIMLGNGEIWFNSEGKVRSINNRKRDDHPH